MVSTPKPPDPKETAQVQGQMNKETAVAQYGLNATNQVTPYGNLTYEQIGKWEDGTPRFQATTSLSDEQQGLLDNYTTAMSKFGNTANAQLDKVSSTLANPWDIDEAAGAKQAGMQRTFMDPQWDRQYGSMQTELVNRGLMPGSAEYKARMADFSRNRQSAYDQMYLDSYKTAVDTAQRERDQPLKELTAMLSGTQPTTPQFTNTPNAGIAPVDYTGLVQQNYQAQLQNSQSKMGGIFGMIAPLMGGWASGGFGWSDRRLKTDIRLLARDMRGWGLYAFRYLWDAASTRRYGYMADEVERLAPHAVAYQHGFAMVNYGALDA